MSRERDGRADADGLAERRHGAVGAGAAGAVLLEPDDGRDRALRARPAVELIGFAQAAARDLVERVVSGLDAPPHAVVAQLFRQRDREHARVPAPVEKSRLNAVEPGRLDEIVLAEGHDDDPFVVPVVVPEGDGHRAVVVVVPALHHGNDRQARGRVDRQRPLGGRLLCVRARPREGRNHDPRDRL